MNMNTEFNINREMFEVYKNLVDENKKFLINLNKNLKNNNIKKKILLIVTVLIH